ncbi:MAG: hypothetical protein HN669_06140 [Candidatus Marinimicrobia bacterium]|jgi:hypothetical protein|nr:hypothetical protein [Candidatus Neomarinimicrobiota bacterium]
MANTQRKGAIQETKGKSLVTPAGSSLWTKVDKPTFDYNPKGQYEAGIVVDPADEGVAKFIATMEKLRDAAVKEAKGNLSEAKGNKLVIRDIVKDDEDKDGNSTGLVVIKTKAYAVDFDGNTVTIPVFNSKGIVQEDFNKLIGNGSTLKLQIWASPYHMASDNSVGISYKLKKVQLIELKEYSGGDDAFGDESGSGFEDSDDTAVNTDEDF